MYAVGDKLAKLHGIKNDNGGFFNLGLDMTKEEPVAIAEEPPVANPVIAEQVPQAVVAEEQKAVVNEKVEMDSQSNIESTQASELKNPEADLLPAHLDDLPVAEKPLVVEEIQIKIDKSDEEESQEEAKHPDEEEEKGDSEGQEDEI